MTQLTGSTATSPDSAFGPLVSGADVGDHLQEILKRWFPSYLYELERLHGVTPGTLPLPRSVVRTHRIERLPEEQLPSLILSNEGIGEPPVTDGGGYYSATWRYMLGAQVAAGPNRRALELAEWYTLALRAAVVQQQQDPALTSPLRLVHLDWISEDFEELTPEGDRTTAVGRVRADVTVAEVLRIPGPLEPHIPPQEPGPESPSWPLADTVTTTVEREPNA